MNHYLYKITNKIDGKYYIGCRTSRKPPAHDTYFGSGIHLTRAVEKYGKENFIKDILFSVETKELKFEAERNIVTQDLVDDPMCYNMKLGGKGGSVKGKAGSYKGCHHSKETKAKMSAAKKGKSIPQETKAKMSASKKTCRKKPKPKCLRPKKVKIIQILVSPRRRKHDLNCLPLKKVKLPI